MNNLNDGMAWGLFPLFFAAAGMSLRQIGCARGDVSSDVGPGQLATGALSDRIGRKWLIAAGHVGASRRHRLIRATSGFGGFAIGGVLLGLGTAMVYPTLLATIGDVAAPRGGVLRSASIGSGATSATSPARSWPASLPTRWDSPVRFGWWRR